MAALAVGCGSRVEVPASGHTTTQAFGTLNVLARVQWHPPDFQNNIIHRGVTLFVPM